MATVSSSVRRWAGRARAHPWATLVGAACRAGYAARGAVYITIGLIALLASVELTPTPEGASDALEAWAQWPAGTLLLWLIGLGLWGFAGWRALQSLFDADNQGTEVKALAARAGQAISGLVYGGLAVSVFGVLDVFEDLGEADDRDETRAAVEQALTLPAGEVLVIALGLFVLACGVGGLVQAARRDFCEDLSCNKEFASRAAILGRIGYGSRGLVFLAAGAFTVFAGIAARSSEAKGAAGALAWFERLPMGSALLAAIAAGLIAFGLFALVEARYRRLHLRGVIDE